MAATAASPAATAVQDGANYQQHTTQSIEKPRLTYVKVITPGKVERTHESAYDPVGHLEAP